MLRDEVARYTELSGNDGLHTPIGIIGAYLDGYEKGRTDAQPKLDENTLSEQQESDKLGVKTGETCTDCISRQAAIEAICEHGTRLERRGITVLAVANHKQATVDLLESLPSAQPTLFGYNIEHLALITTIMQKEHVTPEKALEYFKDIQRMGQMIIDEQQEMIRRAMEKWLT